MDINRKWGGRNGVFIVNMDLEHLENTIGYIDRRCLEMKNTTNRLKSFRKDMVEVLEARRKELYDADM